MWGGGCTNSRVSWSSCAVQLGLTHATPHAMMRYHNQRCVNLHCAPTIHIPRCRSPSTFHLTLSNLQERYVEAYQARVTGFWQSVVKPNEPSITLDLYKHARSVVSKQSPARKGLPPYHPLVPPSSPSFLPCSPRHPLPTHTQPPVLCNQLHLWLSQQLVISMSATSCMPPNGSANGISSWWILSVLVAPVVWLHPSSHFQCVLLQACPQVAHKLDAEQCSTTGTAKWIACIHVIFKSSCCQQCRFMFVQDVELPKVL